MPTEERGSSVFVAPLSEDAQVLDSVTDVWKAMRAGHVAVFAFHWDGIGDQFTLLQDIPGHPKGSTVSARTLREAGVPVPDVPLTIEQKIALARAPISVGILARHGESAAKKAHAGFGSHPTTTVYNDAGRAVGTRALRITSGDGE